MKRPRAFDGLAETLSEIKPAITLWAKVACVPHLVQLGYQSVCALWALVFVSWARDDSISSHVQSLGQMMMSTLGLVAVRDLPLIAVFKPLGNLMFLLLCACVTKLGRQHWLCQIVQTIHLFLVTTIAATALYFIESSVLMRLANEAFLVDTMCVNLAHYAIVLPLLDQ
jgi:hypothetical protein